MRLFRFFIFCLLAIHALADLPRIIPMEDFFKKPEMAKPELSPNGKMISYLKPWNRRLNIFIKNIKTNEEWQVTSSSEQDIFDYFWIDDDTLGYLQDKDGDENDHIYIINTDGSVYKDITPFSGVKCGILDYIKDDKELLFETNQRDPSYFDVYKINLNTYEISLVEKNPGNIVNWITDHDGKIRLAVTVDGCTTTMLFRETEKDEWKCCSSQYFTDNFSPIMFTPNNQNIYVRTNVGKDKVEICEFDPKNCKEVRKVFSHPEVDVSGLIYSEKKQKILGASFCLDKMQSCFFDRSRRRLQNFLDYKLPNNVNILSSCDDSERKFIVLSRSDINRGSYYLLDTRFWKLTKLFDIAPWLNSDELSEMRPFSFTARDGVKINGYITFPRGVEAKNLPLIINPHGGPWVRDIWGYDAESQFLANRGCAVMKINYRGSTGYGKSFWSLGFKQWGLAMSDDITDAVNYALEQGIADPKRIAIYGGSYGGYATLEGCVKTPDLYAAAIDYVGVSNMFTFLETIPSYWESEREMLYKMVGNPNEDREQFEKTSPALNADKIKTPLFIAQGANDPRVKKSESDQMVAALKARGLEVEYMVKNDEGHGFHKEENSFDFYRAMELFLNKHIGTRTP